MRRLLFVLACWIAASSNLLAQGPTAEDAIKSYGLNKKKSSLDVFTFGYNVDMLANAPADMNLSYRSGGISLAFYFNQRFGKSNFSIAEGIGLSSRNYFQDYAFWGNNLTAASPYSQGELDTVVTKNKLVITTLDVPIEFRYTSKKLGKKKTVLKAAVGVTMNLNLDAMKKTVFESGETVKVKGTSDLKNVNTFRAALHARLAINKIGVSMTYSLVPLFKEPALQVTPWSIGLQLVL